MLSDGFNVLCIKKEIENEMTSCVEMVLQVYQTACGELESTCHVHTIFLMQEL
jgi:hypothetical protein